MSKTVSLTYHDLRRLTPGGKTVILKAIAANALILERYGILASPQRLCHFMAQAAHETAGFRTLVEYGNRRYFARRYGHRRDLGNRGPRDGALYRGRGIFQLTGRANYRRFGHALDLDLEADPVLASRPDISLRIACEYWHRHKLGALADRGMIKTITRRINGGYNGLADRQRLLRRARSIWSQGGSVGTLYLQTGSRGPLVRLLQQKLHRAGYPLFIDGLFGIHTRRALKSFQRDNGLRADGIAGSRTLGKLHLELPQISDRPVLPLPSPVFSPSPASPSSIPHPVPPKKPKETYMEHWKSYLQSRTIWANLIGFAALMLDMAGFTGLSVEDQTQLVDHLLKFIEAGGFIGAVIFRAIARDRLGPSFF